MQTNTSSLKPNDEGGRVGKSGSPAESATLPDNPFVGLRPFNINEGLLFFGRGEQTLELLQQLHLTRFLAIVGSSGCGKSSLVRAGLIPKLRAGFLVEQRDQWRVVTTKPGDAPMHNLACSLIETLADGPDADARAKSLAEAMKISGAQAIVEFLTPVLKDLDSNLLLLVDQFEEIFSFGLYGEKETQDGEEVSDKDKQLAERIERERRRDEATDFVSIMMALSRSASLPIYVTMTMRSDFLGDCDAFYGLPQVMNRSQYLVPRLTRHQRQEAIENPIVLYRQTITPRLIDRVLNDAGEEADQLPVMQHAMMRTWEKWVASGDPSIDLPHYEEAGTTNHALSDDAEDALAGMTEEDLEITERLFQTLTDTDARGRRLRRPTHLSELEAIINVPGAKLLEIIEHFRSSGRSFLTLSQDESDPLVDISHESLIRQWTRLREWVSVESHSKDIYLRIAGTAKRYYKPVPEDELARGAALQLALEWREKRKPNQAWADRYHPGLAQTLTFLDESKVQRDKEVAERDQQRNEQLRQAQILAEQKQRVSEAEAAARKTELDQAIALAAQKEAAARRQRLTIYALGVLLVLAVATTAYAVRSGRRARASEELLRSRNQEVEEAFALEIELKNQVYRSLSQVEAAKVEAVKARLTAENEKERAEIARTLAERQTVRANQQARRAALAAKSEKLSIAKEIKARQDAEAEATKAEIAKQEAVIAQREAESARRKALTTQTANQTFRDALAHSKANNPTAAAKEYEEAVKGYESIGDLEGEATTHLELADLRLKAEDSKSLNMGIDHLETASDKYAKIPNPNGEAAVSIKMADFVMDKLISEVSTSDANELKAAAGMFYLSAYGSYKKSKNLQGMIFAADKVYDVMRGSKDPEIAEFLQDSLIEAYEGTLPFYAEENLAPVPVYLKMGKIYRDLKKPEEEKENFRKALDVYRDSEDAEAKARTYVDIGFTLGGDEDIRAYTDQALQGARASQNPLIEANTLSYVGSRLSDRLLKGARDVFRSVGNFDLQPGLADAVNYYKKALLIYEGLGDRIRQADTLGDLGAVTRFLLDKSVALDHFQKALKLYTAEEHSQRARMLFGIGSIQEDTGELDGALKSYQEALSLFSQERDSVEEMRAEGAIGRVEKAQGKKPQDRP